MGVHRQLTQEIPLEKECQAAQNFYWMLLVPIENAVVAPWLVGRMVALLACGIFIFTDALDWLHIAKGIRRDFFVMVCFGAMWIGSTLSIKWLYFKPRLARLLSTLREQCYADPQKATTLATLRRIDPTIAELLDKYAQTG